MRAASWRISILIFVCTCVCVHGAPVREGHPRIYLTPETVPEIQRRSREEYKALYENFKSASWVLGREPGVSYSDLTNMTYPALAYIVEEEPAYADHTKRYLDALSANPPHDQYMTPEYIRQAALCYDWIYDTLSDEEKQRYAAALVDMGDYMLTLWRHKRFQQPFRGRGRWRVIYIGVVLHGDGVDDEAAQTVSRYRRGVSEGSCRPGRERDRGESTAGRRRDSPTTTGVTRGLWRITVGDVAGLPPARICLRIRVSFRIRRFGISTACGRMIGALVKGRGLSVGRETRRESQIVYALARRAVWGWLRAMAG